MFQLARDEGRGWLCTSRGRRLEGGVAKVITTAVTGGRKSGARSTSLRGHFGKQSVVQGNSRLDGQRVFQKGN